MRFKSSHSLLPRLAVMLASMMSCGFSVAAATDQLILAHYMPWYGTKEVSGQWGWHWTMNHFNPDRVGWTGNREAATHDAPLIGLYDSGDAHALECQVLLMKLAGIDGVIIDWYGTKDFNDYATNHRNTEKLVPWIKKAGLRFAICYEDQAIGQMIQGKGLTAEEGVKQGSLDLQWAEQHWFTDEAYVKQDGRPVMLVFGPQYFKREQWDTLRAALASKPLLFALPHLAKDHGADGLYGWPPVTGGKTLSPEQWCKELEVLYARGTTGESVIATAFPGFNDIYKQAGVHDSYGSIAWRSGATLTESLDLAMKSGSKIIQIATWNDYGEGTMIEPTRSNGYRNLELLQAQQRTSRTFSVADLRLPVALYQLRKRCTGDAAITEDLDQAANLLFASKCREAEAALDKIAIKLGQRPATFPDFPNEPREHYRLLTEVLYRDGKDLTAAMQQRCRLDFYYPVDKPFSTVVWFHGGGFTTGERFIPMPLREKGIAVVAVNYRLSPGAKSPAFIEDAAAALAWTFKNIANYGGSTNRIFVSGHSAGAYLATMIGLDKHWLAAHEIDANRIAGLIPLSSQMITHFTIRGERGIDGLQPVVDGLAPLFHVRKDASPMLIITGDREKELMGRYEENAYFWRMMQLVGHKESPLRELTGFDHGGMAEPAMPLLLNFIQEHSPKPLLFDDAGKPIESAKDWEKQRSVIKKAWLDILGNFPTEKAPLKSEIIDTQVLPDHTRQHVKYQIEDGVFTDAWLLIPSQAKKMTPAVVVFHPTVKTHAQQVAGVDASNPELMQGLQLVQRGYIVLCPRCFIFDDGADYAGNVKLLQERHPTWTGMARMTWDGIRAADYLQSLPQVDGDRIGCLGHSLGAKEVLYAAAFDERFKAAVFSEGGIGLDFSNWEAVWYLGPRIRKPEFKHDHHELISLIAPRPFLLLAGDSADGEKSAAFIEAARPVYALLGMNDNVRMLNHHQDHRYPAEAQTAAGEFLDLHLKKGSNPGSR